MNILVINCGSSSLKFQVINAESEKLLAKGLCERIGMDGVPASLMRTRQTIPARNSMRSLCLITIRQ